MSDETTWYLGAAMAVVAFFAALAAWAIVLAERGAWLDILWAVPLGMVAGALIPPAGVMVWMASVRALRFFAEAIGGAPPRKG